jgi:predicted transcriptional regulator
MEVNMPGKKRFDSQISFPVSPEMKETLEAMAVERQTTVSQLARIACDEFVIRETKRRATGTVTLTQQMEHTTPA